jgi:hypothetical protein
MVSNLTLRVIVNVISIANAMVVVNVIARISANANIALPANANAIIVVNVMVVVNVITMIFVNANLALHENDPHFKDL